MDTGSHVRINEGAAKELAKDGMIEDAVELMKSAALRTSPPPVFEYTFKWTHLVDILNETNV